jgi:hypothetical protein
LIELEGEIWINEEYWKKLTNEIFKLRCEICVNNEHFEKYLYPMKLFN